VELPQPELQQDKLLLLIHSVHSVPKMDRRQLVKLQQDRPLLLIHSVHSVPKVDRRQLAKRLTDKAKIPEIHFKKK
jgi:hypothetical protein